MKKRILVVDSEAACRWTVKQALSGCEILEAADGDAAKRILGDMGVHVDLCLLAIDMPGADGLEIYNSIRGMEGCSSLPVVFLTGEDDIRMEAHCLEIGGSDFIRKPFVPLIIRARVMRILELEEFRGNLSARLELKTREMSDIQSRLNKDPLTGLWNREYMEHSIDNLIKSGTKGTLMMLDMDNFKIINDRYGHMSGDQVLKDLAHILQRHFRDGDVLCRVGGDEFMVFVNGLSSKNEISNRASDIIYDMVRKIQEYNFDTNSSVSIGIAQTPQDGSEFRQLYHCADKALYHVKQSGKNSFCFYGDQHDEESKRAAHSVALRQIEDMFKRVDAGIGAYLLDFDTFPIVYNFIRRFAERNGRDVQIVSFTAVQNDASASVPPDELERVLGILNDAIFNSLRRVDVSTRYSSKQMIVLLMDANTENGDMVAHRVIDRFMDLYGGNDFHLEYDIVRMEVAKNR